MVCVWNFEWHGDVIKWKYLPRYWPFVRGIHRSPVDFPHKGQWRGVLMFSLICACTNGWANNRDAGYLRRHRAHYDVTVMNISNNMCSLLISLNFVAKGPIDNNHALVYIIAWHRIGDTPLSEPMLTRFTDANMWHLGVMICSNKPAPSITAVS